ncbi:MAG TPA: 30S ribosomal protein S18 [Candidatus Sulfotelmatobacter sp.]|nr:30S ribosomal protein S18 [Candidatus Sulfotelmatobacter sp.]
MAKKKRIIRKNIKNNNVPKKCYFCSEKKEPGFEDVAVLNRFLTDRAKIVARSRSGLCAKHQKRLTLSVKHARHLALIPFTVSV